MGRQDVADALQRLKAYIKPNPETQPPPTPELPPPDPVITDGHLPSTNGHQRNWPIEAGYAVKHALDLVPEKDRPTIASMNYGELVEQVVQDALRLVKYVPEDLSDSEVNEDLHHHAEKAVKIFQGIYLPALSNGQLEEGFQLPEVFIRNKIEIVDWRTLRERRLAHVESWVVDRWLGRGEVSLWSGKVEHGKTTLMRELTMCVLRGEPFLGREAKKGKVVYAMLDADGPHLTYDEFDKMGMSEGDDIQFIFEPTLASMQNGPEQFFKLLWDSRPDLVIIDPFPRLKQITDFNDYNNTYLMAMLSQYSKALDAHFALPGHIPRGRPASADVATAQFGSVAFGAGVNARFVVKIREGTSTHILQTSKGKSAGFEALEGEHVLRLDPVTSRVTLEGPFNWKDEAREFMPAIRRFLDDDGGEFSGKELGKEIGARRSAATKAANILADEGSINRRGKGRRGDPHLFSRLTLQRDLDDHGISKSK